MATRKKKQSSSGGSGSLFDVLEKGTASDLASRMPSELGILEAKSKLLTVSQFLDGMNSMLREMEADILGEVVEVSISGKAVYFTIKDKEDGSMLRCSIWLTTYQSLGVRLDAGMEIKVSGYMEVYKPRGAFTFRVRKFEPVGEGALKKAYELLLKQLQAEGLFERKRPLPEYIENIGLITSLRSGVVVHDFTRNLKPLGFHIRAINSRVEGLDAVREISAAVKQLASRDDIDVIVIIRGGGDLESMQAFNNEVVCREIFASKIPVIVGIGHEVNVPIACLVADRSESTPTATAVAINESWRGLLADLPVLQNRVIRGQAEALRQISDAASGYVRGMMAQMKNVFGRFDNLATAVTTGAMKTIAAVIAKKKEFVARMESALRLADPERNLRLGYSILFNAKGKVIKGVADVAPGDKIRTKLSDGELESTVDEVRKKSQ